MRWAKRGLIYVPSGDWWWSRSHAYVPTAEVLEDEGIIRVYFASWDENQIGRIGYVDLDIDDSKRILYLTKEPVLDIGEIGTFDDCGVGPSCVLNVGDKKYLYYYGFQRTEKEAVHMVFAGLAISDDGGKTFRRFSQVPILDRTPDEPFLRSSVSVIVEDGLCRMWYTSALKWFDLGVNPLFSKTRYPIYVIRYTESADGIRWSGKSHICVDFKTDDEFGLGRPWVIKNDGVYRMWYSIRSKIRPYRIGYAESKDGLNWVRKDNEVGIEASETGWDSEMICYPCVVDVKDKRYMFYNGNRHGQSGFGYAELESV